MMGPREPGSAPPARSAASPLNLHQRSATGPSHPFPSSASPVARPFEREVSPQPMPTTLPLRTQSQSRTLPPTHLNSQPRPSPSRSTATPSPAQSLDECESLNASTSSNPAAKRPLTAASPRASPAKKVASLAMAFDNGGSPPFPRGPSSGHPLRTNRTASNSSTSSSRVASGSYAAGRSAPRSGRRVASNSSTIRGMSPPPKPKIADEMDVFDDSNSLSPAPEVLMLDEVSFLGRGRGCQLTSALLRRRYCHRSKSSASTFKTFVPCSHWISRARRTTASLLQVASLVRPTRGTSR